MWDIYMQRIIIAFQSAWAEAISVALTFKMKLNQIQTEYFIAFSIRKSFSFLTVQPMANQFLMNGSVFGHF